VKVAEKFVGKVLPRVIKRGGKALGARLILTKIGRGVAIAIPAIGGLFAALITVVDYRRMRHEHAASNLPAAHAFTSAAVCDAIDVIAHLITAAGLSGALATVIPDAHLLHDIIHVSETASIISAVIATASAIGGEFLSVNKQAVEDIEEEIAEEAAEAAAARREQLEAELEEQKQSQTKSTEQQIIEEVKVQPKSDEGTDTKPKSQ
jgi:thiamine pyrophosphate-dependent acetolactate synthase large subunit-like protein